MDAKIDRLIELSYELEGLLLLAKNKKENQQQIVTLAKAKLNTLETAFADLVVIDQDDDVIVESTVEFSESKIDEVCSTDNSVSIECEIDSSETESECDNNDENIIPISYDYSRSLKQFFTINDKFRFRRELFGNSDSAFADTMNILSAMSSLAEVQDYLANDLEWDLNNEEVTEFTAIIEAYFKSRVKE